MLVPNFAVCKHHACVVRMWVGNRTNEALAIHTE